MDIFPTLLEMSNINLISDRIMDGISLKNTLLNNEASKRETVFYYRQREIYAVRHREYKAHFITRGAYNYPEGSNKKIVLDKPLLYNLNIDPSEKYDIADKYPEVLIKINKIVEKHKLNLDAPKDLIQEREFTEGDRDGDGVPDYTDKCPDSPGNPSSSGCPN